MSLSFTNGNQNGVQMLLNGYLKIVGVSLGDGGFYTCHAKNIHGDAQTTTNVIVSSMTLLYQEFIRNMKQNHRKVNQNNFQKTNLLYWNLLFCLFGFSSHDEMYTHLFMLTSILLSLLLLTRDVFRILHISLITCFENVK